MIEDTVLPDRWTEVIIKALNQIWKVKIPYLIGATLGGDHLSYVLTWRLDLR